MYKPVISYRRGRIPYPDIIVNPKVTQYKREVGKIINMQGRPRIPDGLLTMNVVLRLPLDRELDTDNSLKALQDAIADTYGFNDNRVRDLHVYRRYSDKENKWGCTVVFTPCNPTSPIHIQ